MEDTTPRRLWNLDSGTWPFSGSVTSTGDWESGRGATESNGGGGEERVRDRRGRLHRVVAREGPPLPGLLLCARHRARPRYGSQTHLFSICSSRHGVLGCAAGDSSVVDVYAHGKNSIFCIALGVEEAFFQIQIFLYKTSYVWSYLVGNLR